MPESFIFETKLLPKLMQAVILAGGQGTRLKSINTLVAKPMMPIGNKPLLEHQVELLKSFGIRDVIILVNHLKESIQHYFHDGSKWGMNISYYEEVVPLGTVGGVKAIEDQITGDFLVVYGDVMLSMDIARLIRFHKEKKSACTLVLHPNDHPYDSDLVELDHQGKISTFHSKPHEANRYYRNMVNAGVYVFSKSVFDFLEKDKKADFGKDIFPVLVNKISMFGYNTTEKGGKRVAFEWLTIALQPNGIVYLAQPEGRTPATPFAFVDGEGARFENPSNEFPQRLQYTPETDALHVVVSAGEQKLEWTWRRVGDAQTLAKDCASVRTHEHP